MGFNPNSTGAKSALSGSTSGTFTQIAATVTSSYTIIWPNTQGTGSLINDGTGNLSWEGSAGTVTSVGLSLPSIFAVTGSPVVGAGTLTGTLLAQSANTVWAGPTTGSAAVPSFRSLVGADLPLFSTSLPGAVSASGGGTANFLRADGTWAAPVSNAYNVNTITLTPTDITNQFVTLTSAPTTATKTVLNVVGGITQSYGSDFTVSGSTLTFAGDLATGGNAALISDRKSVV